MPPGAKPWLKGRKRNQLNVRYSLSNQPASTVKSQAVPDTQPLAGAQTRSSKRKGGKNQPSEIAAQPSAKRIHSDRTAAASGTPVGNGTITAAAISINDDRDNLASQPAGLSRDGTGEAAHPDALAGLERVPISQLQQTDRQAQDGAGPVSWRNKEKVLMLTSRGIPPRHRHLMLDLAQLLPNAKRDAKLDTKSDRTVINEAADLKGCTSALFFEARKRRDCYLWAAKVPSGPTAKFLIVNVHTMAELKLSGNHLKGSRPVLSFDQTFDSAPHWTLLKEVLTQLFNTPKRHHKSKPFFDHVITFAVADGRIWLRNYQVCPSVDKKAKADVAAEGGPMSANLVEVGPRACLNPILIFSGAFGGPVIWENPAYVAPNHLRAAAKRREASKYNNKVAKRAARRVHKAENAIPKGELDDLFK